MSEKARTAAFDLLVVMGQKMGEGGTVNRALINGMDTSEDSSTSGLSCLCMLGWKTS